MKKFAALLICFAILFTCLSACTPKDNVAEDTSTTKKESESPTQSSTDVNNTEEDTTLTNPNPVVTITMNSGKTIKIELYPSVAPNTVNNFISIIKKGDYDGTIFHRVIPGFMIQGGDPDGTGSGGPGYCIKGEFSNNGFKNSLKHTRGVISMARTMLSMDSAGCQFFIMVEDSSYLDGDYATFGKVTEGMDVVDEIVSVSRNGNDRPNTDQIMETVTVDTFGVDYPEPETVPEN